MALILVSLVQLAFIFERQIGIENAVRDAARRAATYTTNSAALAGTNGTFVLNLLETDILPNSQGYADSNLELAKVCYDDAPAASGYTEVTVNVLVRYRHPLFLPLITQILDGIDGTTDNAFAAQTESQFVVENDASSNQSIGGVEVCRQDANP